MRKLKFGYMVGNIKDYKQQFSNCTLNVKSNEPTVHILISPMLIRHIFEEEKTEFVCLNSTADCIVYGNIVTTCRAATAGTSWTS